MGGFCRGGRIVLEEIIRGKHERCFLPLRWLDYKRNQNNLAMRIFISSPYTIGDAALNVRAQIDAADELMTLGHAPYTPLLSHFQHIIHPRPIGDWMELDLEWMKVCNCLLRLPGPSRGAGIEIEYAKKMGLPVYFSIDELIKSTKP